MSRKAVFVLIAAALVAMLATNLTTYSRAEAQEAGSVALTVRNVTAGQPLTPPVVVVHDDSADLLPESAEDLAGLEELAESGQPAALAASLRDVPGVKGTLTFDLPPLPPRQEATATIAASPGDHVSVISMLACTNDAIAIGTLIVPEAGSLPAMSSGRVYDAGTEENAETAATVPCLGGEGVSSGDAPDGEGSITHHAGIGGEADLSAEQHGWDGPAMQLFLTSADGSAPAQLELGLTLKNLTGGQPITPPVAVVHDPNVDVISYTEPSDLDGIDDLSESGAQGDLVATLRARPGVVSVYGLDSGGPIVPGGSFTTDIAGVEGAAVSVVGMFACTNDAYILATAPFERGGSVIADVFDSGAEANDETTATVPCLGGGDAALSEGVGEGTRAMHPGISGGADLDPAVHGWTAETTAWLVLHEAGRETSEFDITVRNVTAGQPLTPPVVVVHDGNAVLLPDSAEDLAGLEALAESGQGAALAVSLRGVAGVKDTINMDPPPLPPGQEAIATISASPGDHVSVISMLACTNDAIAIGTLIVPEAGALPAMSSGRVYDAGTEENAETAATVPCLGGEGVSSGDAPDGEGLIAHHPGIVGEADLSAEQHGWDGPAMQLFLTSVGGAAPAQLELGLTLKNLTGGQPITPPVAVVHDPNVNVVSYTEPSELDGIDDLSESGAQGDLIATLRARPGVVSVYGLDSGGPIVPGGSFTTDIAGVEGAAVSVVGMFACTNDAYILATAPFAQGGSVVADVFDSGAENNDETAATVPCLGGGDAALSEGVGEGTRAMHPGVTGGADLNPAVHGWTAETTAELTLHEAGRSAVVVPAPPFAPPKLPSTGGYAPSAIWLLAVAPVGVLSLLWGSILIVRQRSRRSARR